MHFNTQRQRPNPPLSNNDRSGAETAAPGDRLAVGQAVEQETPSAMRTSEPHRGRNVFKEIFLHKTGDPDMPFAVYCLDRPDAGDLRQRTRAVHLEYMIAHGEQVTFGGPLQTDDGSRVIGSLMVLSHETREAVDRFLQAEPYARAGLFAEVRISRLRQMVPENPPGLLIRELERERGAG
jgi:uncharacterized protein YciI